MDGKKRIAARRKMEAWRKEHPIPLRKSERLRAEQARRERQAERIKQKIALKANQMAVKAALDNRFIFRMEDFGLRQKVKSPENKEGMVQVRARYGEMCWVPKNPLKSPWRYIDWLKGKGFVELGAGAYSTVLAKPNSKKVIKVSRSLDNWIDYIQWAAKEGFAGNLAPRVYSWKRHTCGNIEKEFSVAVVERMKEPLGSDYKSDESLLLSLCYYAKRDNLLAQCYMEEIIPGSVRFFKELSRQDLDGDIGGRNVMVRENGTLCITDPCCGSIRTTVKRLRSGDLSPSALIYYGSQIESCNRYRS